MSPRVSLHRSTARWAPAILVATLICYWSIVASPLSIILPLEEATSTHHTSVRAAVVSPFERDWFDPRHGIAYGVLACSFEDALTDREPTKARIVLLAFAATVGYGVLMEISQLFRPDRVASVADGANNAVGTGVTLAFPGLEKQIPGNPFSPSNG